MIGAIGVPLGLEAHWRHAQPEAGVITRAGELISKGEDPYRAYDEHGHLVNAIRDLPAFESFFPYFPLMGVFGLPSAESHKGKGLTDARIIMTLMSIIVSAWALALLRASREQKIRVAQVLIALPTGALFFATGGDDMPILALMLARGRGAAAATVESRGHQSRSRGRHEADGVAHGGGGATRHA